MIVTIPIFVGIATILVAVRDIARSPRRFELWGWDDTLIVATWLFSLPIAVIQIFLIKNGIGQDIWRVDFAQIGSMLFTLWLVKPFYLLSTAFMKLSMLAFYLRLFVDYRFRKIVYGMMACLVALIVAYLFALVLECSPINYAWERWDSEKHGTCTHTLARMYSCAAIDIVGDLAVLALPVPLLAQMKFTYSWKAKAQIGIMFSTGLLVTIVSGHRLHSLIKDMSERHFMNMTWDYFGPALWSAVECFTGIICACLPAARLFFTSLLPQWLGLSARALPAQPANVVKNKILSKNALSWLTSLSRTSEHGTITIGADFHKLKEVFPGSSDNKRQTLVGTRG